MAKTHEKLVLWDSSLLIQSSAPSYIGIYIAHQIATGRLPASDSSDAPAEGTNSGADPIEDQK